MISNAAAMPYTGGEEPRRTFKSKISSPTKRTLNNKNYLADDAPPAPVFDYTGGLGQDLTDKLRLSTGPRSSNEKDGKPLLLAEPPSQYLMQNYRMELKSIPGFQTSQQQPRSGQITNRTSPGKTARAAGGKPKNVRCKEKKDASMVPSLSKVQRQKIIENRYFSAPVDLQKRKRTEGRLRPVINVAYSSGKNTNYRNYRLFSPLMLCEKGPEVLSKEIENVYRAEYRKAQPLCRYGDRNVTYKSLREMTAGLTEYLRDAKIPTTTAGGRPLMTGSSWNESFELSFDGKAIDRSDIFRMVDSFSVALSDEEPEEDASRGDVVSSNVLPAEMTSPAF